MTIDQRSRDRLTQDSRDNGSASVMKNAVVSAVKENNSGGNPNEEVLKLIVQREEQGDSKEAPILSDISRSILSLRSDVRSLKLEVPKIQQVVGKIDVGTISDMPDINVKNLNSLAPYFTQLGEQISKISMALALAGKTAPVVKVNAPVIDSSVFKPLTDSLASFKDQLNTANNEEVVTAIGRVEEALVVLANRPTMTGASSGGRVKSLSNPILYGMPIVNPDGSDLSVNIDPGDVEIGAVEIKNSTDDTRATVGTNGLYVDVQAGNITKIGGASFLLGQQLAASSVPVVLTATQLSTLTPLSSVTVNTISGFALETGGNLATAVTNLGTIHTDLKANITLHAGTNVIGKVSQDTSPWVVSGAVTNTVLSVVGGGTEATAQRVTIASDSTGLLSIDDNGGSLTVDNGGTFAVQATPVLIASVIVGQKKLTASAVQLGSNALTNGVIFSALSTNVGNIFIGGSGVTTTADGTGNGYILEPGTSISFAATNTNLYYVIGD